MGEKKIVVYDLRLSYNGIIDVEQFYKNIDDWAREKELSKEIKKNLEHVTSEGKKIEYIVEYSKELTPRVTEVVRIRVLMNNVKETYVVRKGRKIKVNNADVLVILDGLLESLLAYAWEQQPWYYFIRTLIDKYIWIFHSWKYDGVAAGDTQELFNKVKMFFNQQTYI